MKHFFDPRKQYKQHCHYAACYDMSIFYTYVLLHNQQFDF